MRSISQINRDIKKITVVLFLVLIFVSIEILGHYKSNSLALLADAIHLIVDTLGLITTAISLFLIKKGLTSENNFGMLKLESLSALFSILIIWFAIGKLTFEAILRTFEPERIEKKPFLIISGIGFCLNMINLFIIGHDCSHSLSMSAVYIHIIGDVLISAGNLLVACLQYFYQNFLYFDTIATFFYAIIIILSSINILKASLRILLDLLPEDIDIKNLKKSILEVESVFKIKTIKIWAQTSDIYALNLQIKTKKELTQAYEFTKLKEEINEKISNFNKKIFFSTIEIN